MAFRFVSLPILAATLLAGPVSADPTACDAPAPVCQARRFVLAIVSGGTEASAVYVAPGRLVTNRHVVADRPSAIVTAPDGTRLDARVIPSGYPGDLILLSVDRLDFGTSPPAAGAIATVTELYVVGFDLGTRQIRVYPGGRPILAPAQEKPLARLQHSAGGAAGNSGGLLADANGAFVGIVTTGSRDLGEAIPASEIARLDGMSGPSHDEAHRRLSRAYAACMEALRHVPPRRGRLPQRLVTHVTDTCTATGNRQLVSRGGEVLGQAGHLDEARHLFALALDADPHSLEARQGLIVALHLAGRYAEAIPHIRWLMEILPTDSQVLRLAIQAGKLAGDGAIADAAYEKLKQHHPVLAVTMRRFLDAPLPPGFRPGQ